MKYRVLIIFLVMAIFSALLVGCNNDETPNDDKKPEEPTEEYVELTVDEYFEKTTGFSSIADYMVAKGYDATFEMSSGDSLIKCDASLDISQSDDALLDIKFSSSELKEGQSSERKLNLYLGGKKLYMEKSADGVTQRDSMTIDNNISNIVTDLLGGDADAIIEYIISQLISEFSNENFIIDLDISAVSGLITQFKDYLKISFCEGSAYDNYILSLDYDGGEQIDGKDIDPFALKVDYNVKAKRICLLTAEFTSEERDFELTLTERTASSPYLDAPSNKSEFVGTILDQFEELYNNRSVTYDSFLGEWSDGENSLSVTAQSLKLTMSTGEFNLIFVDELFNYITARCGEDIYVLHLKGEGELEVILPDDSTITLVKNSETL